MAEVLIPADDEVAVVRELSARMTAQIGTRVPSRRPAEFGRVVSAGGTARDLVTDSFTLALEGFATTETRARRLCAEMIAHLQAAGRAGSVGGVTCYGVRAPSLPANLPMPSVPDRFRFTATVSVDLRRVGE
ncbi:hypothetical protein K8F61_17110 [Microbacterium resistens]|uniref:Tail terminator n=1 Tax=Microbacterium resistens TaxID=156977 RepID=A0ABY3RQU1_9MICO|nr:hypothetical protein [Microbacterium resistens]UGS26324.1 hypothetical protein K8F61_17110 [Microbacterium resistens]